MATRRVGPLGLERALAAAPVPRPPQPTRATWMVVLSPAWTCGITTLAQADATATWPGFLINSRRGRPVSVRLLTRCLLIGMGKSRRHEGVPLVSPSFER